MVKRAHDYLEALPEVGARDPYTFYLLQGELELESPRVARIVSTGCRSAIAR